MNIIIANLNYRILMKRGMQIQKFYKANKSTYYTKNLKLHRNLSISIYIILFIVFLFNLKYRYKRQIEDLKTQINTLSKKPDQIDYELMLLSMLNNKLHSSLAEKKAKKN